MDKIPRVGDFSQEYGNMILQEGVPRTVGDENRRYAGNKHSKCCVNDPDWKFLPGIVFRNSNGGKEGQRGHEQSHPGRGEAFSAP